MLRVCIAVFKEIDHRSLKIEKAFLLREQRAGIATQRLREVREKDIVCQQAKDIIFALVLKKCLQPVCLRIRAHEVQAAFQFVGKDISNPLSCPVLVENTPGKLRLLYAGFTNGLRIGWQPFAFRECMDSTVFRDQCARPEGINLPVRVKKFTVCDGGISRIFQQTCKGQRAIQKSIVKAAENTTINCSL